MNFVAFNQDASHLAVGGPNGFQIYYTDPFSKCYESREGHVSIVEMLYSTALVALVHSPRRLIIMNTKRNSTICELTFPTGILGVRLNRKRMVVILESQIYLYDISNMRLVHTIDTSPNPHGLSVLSPSAERCYLAYPLPQKTAPSPFTPPSHVPPTTPNLNVSNGHVLIFDCMSFASVNVIEAHQSPLSCLAMNSDGTRLATASEKGTIIRVFSIPDGQKLYQFRRGSMPARIYSMAFNLTSTLLCASSSTDTIHIFRLTPANEPPASTFPRPTCPPASTERSMSPASESSSAIAGESETSPTDITARKHNGTLAGMIRRTSQNVTKSFAASIGGYLPTAVSEMLEPTRDFAWFKIPKSSTGASNSNSSSNTTVGASSGSAVRSVVAMSSNSPQVMVVTSDGGFYVFNIDLEKGGEGTLTRQNMYVTPKVLLQLDEGKEPGYLVMNRIC